MSMGGTLTSLAITKGVFPFFDYVFNSIKVKTEVVKGASYSAFCGIEVGVSIPFVGYVATTLITSINLIGANDALFSINNEDSKIVKSAIGKTMILDMFGSISDNPVKMNISGYTCDSTKLNFPISNMKIIVNKNSTLTLSAKKDNSPAKYQVYPNSEIHNHGKILVENGVKLSFVNIDMTDEIISGITYSNTKMLFEIFKQNNSNRILYQYKDSNITGNVYIVAEEGSFENEENLEDSLLSNTKYLNENGELIEDSSTTFVKVTSSSSIKEYFPITTYLLNTTTNA